LDKAIYERGHDLKLGIELNAARATANHFEAAACWLQWLLQLFEIVIVVLHTHRSHV